MINRLVVLAACGFLLAACSSTKDTATTTGGATGTGTDGLGSAGGVSSSGLNGYGSGGVQPGSQADLEVNVGDKVYFGFDNATLDDAARQTLDRQASWLQQFNGVGVTVEGHTDERGTREYNLALGERRATAVKSYLGALGVSSSRIQTVSYGEERPAQEGSDENAFALNRRAVTSVALTN